MLDGTLIRKRVDAVYARIKESESDLQYLREKCEHVHKHVVMCFSGVTDAEDSVVPKKKIICDYCDKLLGFDTSG